MAESHIRSAKAKRQRGIAAIEFAFIAMIMLVMLLGSLVYWRAFQAQQSLTRAAGDGARAAHSLIASGLSDPCHPTKAATNQTKIEERIKQSITRSLEQSSMPGTVAQQLDIRLSSWACPNSGKGSFSFELQYALPPMLGTTASLLLEPSQVYEKSVVHFASMF